jgi:hypothetical protein
VRLLFDDPDLNLRAQYTLFDRVSGRPVCVGNGDAVAPRPAGFKPCLALRPNRVNGMATEGASPLGV